MGENMQWKDGGDDFELVEIQNAACEYDMELAERKSATLQYIPSSIWQFEFEVIYSCKEV